VRGRALAALAAATVLLAAGVAMDTPAWLRGPAPYPPEWQWTLRAGPTSGRFAPVAVAVVGLGLLAAATATAAARRSPRRWGRLTVALAVPVGMLLSLALLGLEPGGALATLGARAASRSHSSYHAVAVSPEARDPLAFLRRHASLLPELRDTAKHAATHPPGPVLYFRAVLAVTEAWPALSTAVLRAQGRDPARPLRDDVAAARAAATLGALGLVLAASLGAWPVSELAARAAGDCLSGARVGLLWVLLPAPALLVPQFDALVALLVAATAALLSVPAARRGRTLGAGLGAGFLAGLALFFSYGAAPFLGLAGLAAGCFAADTAGRKRWLAAGGLAAAVALGMFAGTALLGHEPWSALRTALAIHRQDFTAPRRYALWLAFDPLDLAVLGGLPVTASFLARAAAAAVRVRRAWAGSGTSRGIEVVGSAGSEAGSCVALVTAAALAALVLSGLTRGEVGRLWMPVLPFVLVGALAARGRPDPRTALAVGAMLALLTVTLRAFWIL
jgi:hypothetical protein